MNQFYLVEYPDLDLAYWSVPYLSVFIQHAADKLG